ncbi:MAG: hypothetical protein NVSMB62_27100 [Acidobacteriaceae bacterium]
MQIDASERVDLDKCALMLDLLQRRRTLDAILNFEQNKMEDMSFADRS